MFEEYIQKHYKPYKNGDTSREESVTIFTLSYTPQRHKLSTNTDEEDQITAHSYTEN